ncbi:MAG: AmmeMemoRadiSam system protein B [Bacillota bacterium]|jgi:AmmeMemoRadiSam system protein B
MRKILIIALVIWIVVSFAAITSGKTGTGVKPGTYPPVHTNNFFDPAYFYTGKFSEIVFSGDIRGAVIPHHLLAHKSIAQVFAYLKRQNPSTIILIAPNHHNNGEQAITSSLGWQTPFGVVEADDKLISRLQDKHLLNQDDQICGQEHAVGNIMPFIKYYLPQTKVVPIILHSDISLTEANMLGTQLAKQTGKDTVMIASVDFSHGLKAGEAKIKDQETLAVLRNGNMGRLFNMGNEYLDSPAAIGALFSAMKYVGIQDFSVLEHINSGDIFKNKKIKTTSYFTLLFFQ